MKSKLLVLFLALLIGLSISNQSTTYADAGGVVSTSNAKDNYISTYSISLVNNSKLELAGNPQKPAISSYGDFILVPAKDFNLLYYIKIINKEPVLEDFTIPTGKSPTDVVISKYNTRAYVVNKLGNSISIIDLRDSEPSSIAEINVGLAPSSLALGKNDQYLYVANDEDNTVTVIKLDDKDSQIVNTIKVGIGPNSIKISDDGNAAYVVNRGDNTVTEIDLTNPEGVIAKDAIQVGTYPSDISISNGNNLALVTNTLDNNVSLFDPMASLSITLGKIQDISKPFGITKSTKNEFVVIPSFYTGGIKFYSLKKAAQQQVNRITHDIMNITEKPEFIALNDNSEVIAITHPSKNLLSLVSYHFTETKHKIPAITSESQLKNKSPLQQIIQKNLQNQEAKDVQELEEAKDLPENAETTEEIITDVMKDQRNPTKGRTKAE